MVAVVVTKALVWVRAVIDILIEVLTIIGVRADVVIDALTEAMVGVGVDVMALYFAVPVAYSVGLLSDVVVDALIDPLADVIMDFVSGIGVEVLPDANGNAFTSLTIVLEFVAPKP